ncbi:S-layer homology domain-containing protein [Cohnella sp. GCM10027633]|uniref:S-layer homology domain-containing protein n=1 Tax=unclassified Cohnella TaxID=2636738 RepID=UPI00362BEAFE
MHRIVKITLATAVILSGFLGAGIQRTSASSPSDIADHWAKETISAWIERGLIDGYADGSFRPDDAVKRAEAAALINRSFGLGGAEAIGYSDVNASDWYYEAVGTANSQKYMSGYPDGTFKPNGLVTRQELAVILSRLLVLPVSNSYGGFEDTKNRPGWSKGAIGAVVEARLMSGYPDRTFRPDRPVSRAEVVATLDRALKSRASAVVRYAKAGVYGPSEGNESIRGNVEIQAPGVTLRNVTINGDLLLGANVGEGDVILRNVKVTGLTEIHGGGANSVHIENSVLAQVIVDKANHQIRIVLEGDSSVEEIVLQSGAKLEEADDASPGGVNVVTLSEQLPEKISIELSGSFDTVNVLSGNVVVSLLKGVVQQLNVSADSANNEIKTGMDTTIANLLLDAVTKVVGSGTIEKAIINVNGTTFEKAPLQVVKKEGVDSQVGNSTGGGGTPPAQQPTAQERLQTAKTNTAALQEGEYSSDSWAILAAALGLPETTSMEVSAKTTAIEAAIAGLINAQAAADLAAAVAEANALAEADYTTGSWSALETALSGAEATNAQVVAKTAAIEAAIVDLVFAGAADLAAVVAEANALAEADYTTGSWSALETALSGAEATNAQVAAKMAAIEVAIADLVFAGAAGLADAVAEANALTEADYTTASWSALETALSSAEATNAQVAAKTTAIYSAIADFVFAGAADLAAVVAEADALAEADYTTGSWSALETALSGAEATNAQVVAKTTGIEAAIADLVFAGTAGLADAVAEANALAEADYTTASWSALETVLSGAEATNAQVAAKTTAIYSAIADLVFAGAADLAAVVAEANALAEADYTTGSWSALETALSSAEATNAQVVAKTTAIEAAIADLVFAGAAGLADAVAEANALAEADYTTGSWSALETALVGAETTNAQVVAKKAAIYSAIADLVFAGAADLVDAVAEANALAEADYTTGSWSALETALGGAETTNAQVVAKTAAIEAAIADLVFAGAAGLADAVAVADALAEADYTTASWSALETALVGAETTNVQVVAKKAAIYSAIEDLVFAGAADLAAVVAEANALAEADYTTGSWSALETALSDEEATNAQVVAKTAAIEAAIADLVFAGAADLGDAVAEANALTEEDYMPEDWNALVTALAMTEGTNAQIVAKTTAIEAAISALVTRAEALITAEQTAAALTVTAYTAASWNALQSALALPASTNQEKLDKIDAIGSTIAELVVRVVTSVTIIGESGEPIVLRMQYPGAYNHLPFQAVVRDQFGIAMTHEGVTWSMQGNDANDLLQQVTSSSVTFSINHNANPRTALLVATSTANSSVSATFAVQTTT